VSDAGKLSLREADCEAFRFLRTGCEIVDLLLMTIRQGAFESKPAGVVVWKFSASVRRVHRDYF
jgi:hypothetical protein